MLMSKATRLRQLPAPYAKLQLFADISQYTRQQRRQLQTITKPLNNHKIPYQWGFPTKLLVTKNGVKHAIHTVEEGINLLKKWKIIPEGDTLPRMPAAERQQSSAKKPHSSGIK